MTVLARLDGTAGEDALAARWDGDVVFGLGGDDRLASLFNHTLLHGGAGADLLVTDVALFDFEGLLAITQSGGSGDDRMVVRSLYDDPSSVLKRLVAPVENVTEIAVAAGAGDDLVEVASAARAFLGHTMRIAIDGGAGHDQVRISANTPELRPDIWGQTLRTELSGGAGDDALEVDAVSGADPYGGSIVTLLDGGNGGDALVASARINATGSLEARTMIDGGTGADGISSMLVADFFEESEPVEHRLSGGDGGDSIVCLTHTTGGAIAVQLTEVRAGQGDDIVESTVENLFEGDPGHLVSGGAGNDNLLATSLSGLTTVLGGGGDDVIEGRSPGGELAGAEGANLLRGGAGDDTITGAIAAGKQGRSRLFGDEGDDALSVAGGRRNLLDGGAGADSLTGGRGRDRLVGGTSDDTLAGRGAADTFFFNLGVDEGRDEIVGFRRALDRLAFAGLADAGAPGLVDDLDAMSEVVDAASGGDVEVTLDSGTVLVLVGAGTGASDSWADLVDDAGGQLLLA